MQKHNYHGSHVKYDRDPHLIYIKTVSATDDKIKADGCSNTPPLKYSGLI